jgi:hypothetical protein
MALYPRSEPGTDAYATSRALFDAVITQLSDPQMAVRPEHAVEEFIAGCGRDVLRQALQDHLDARAAAERRRSEVTGADQVVRRRAEPGHTRLLATALGRVEVSRIAYRAPAVSNLDPAGARLALPDGGYSFPLQEAVVHETVTGALREARDGLARILGQRVGTRQLMQITVDATRDVRDFYPQHRVPAPATRAGGQPGPRDLLVLSIDATGINMIDSGLCEAAPTRNTGPQPPSAQLATRDRAGRTRMAVVTACYDAAPAVRDPADILPATGGERASRRPGPTAVNREVDASIADSTVVMTRRPRTPSRRRPEHPPRHPHPDRHHSARAETLHRLPHRETALPHLPLRADHGLANRDGRDRGGLPLPRRRQNGDHRRPLEPARRRSRTPPARRDHERRFRSLLAIPSSTGTPKHPHQPLPAAIRPGRLTKIEKSLR